MAGMETAFVGLDLGTSGCRGLAIDPSGRTLASARAALPAAIRPRPGWVEQDPWIWWQATLGVLRTLGTSLQGHRPAAIAVDATSATLLLASPEGNPLGHALMYDDRRAVDSAARVDAMAPANAPSRGPGSSLAKVLHLHERLAVQGEVLALHQADWIAGCLGARHGHSDWNNALKLGFDPSGLRWPPWVRALLPPGVRLPQVLAPGTPIGTLAPSVAEAIGFPADTRICAGTTDSTAAVIATGARHPGDAVSCLGTTLVAKILSPTPFDDATLGIYSHRLGDLWLVGGASNSGGGVLRQFFSDAELISLSATIDPNRPSGLDYYPLPAVGERFPRNDPMLAPRIEPRPSDPALFLHGLLEGIARIEAEAYACLSAIGAPIPRRILTIGGGASNPCWTRVRERIIGVEICAAQEQEAALGAALLARHA